MINSQNQNGGDGSTNIQARQMVMHIGIDEKRAREIYNEMNLQIRSDYSQEALKIANTRVKDFENRLMSKIVRVEGALEAFADPSFQLLLVEAQKAAASSERPADYDLLSELLIHRFQKGGNRIARTGINLAVEIVDKISDESLLGLTAAHAVSNFVPVSGDIHRGLDVLNDLFGKILYMDLPVGQAWLDHLDILKAVRLNSIDGLKKIQQYYSEKLHGYVDVGISKGSDNHDKAIEIIKNINLPDSILIEHSLNTDFLRVNVISKDNIDNISLAHKTDYEGKPITKIIKISQEQKNAIISLFELYLNDNNIKQNNISLFMIEWEKRPNLKILREWWDNISTSFTLTSVGKVLAHSNAQRCDKDLPPLD